MTTPRLMVRLVVALTLSAAGAIVVHAVPVAAATPPSCPYSNSDQFRCYRYTNTGPRGPITIIGDSVLVGSGFSTSTVPNLPSRLAAAGWGPIMFQAGLGYSSGNTKPADSATSASSWINRWQSSGWDPGVVAVNIGANDFGYCSNSADRATCNERAIDHLLDAIGPNRVVWWSLITVSPLIAEQMEAYNVALRRVATRRPNLVLWDWPAALSASNPPIQMAWDNIHLTSVTQYGRRSELIADHLNSFVSRARYVGPRAALPTASVAGLQYSPVAARTVHTTPSGSTPTVNEVRTIDLSTIAPADAKAAVVSIKVTAPQSNGYATVWNCSATRPTVSSLNYAAGTARAAQSIGALSTDRRLCVLTSSPSRLTVTVHGFFVTGSATRLSPISPTRLLDTRKTGRRASFRLAVPAGAAAAALNVTALQPSPGGTIAVYPCGSTEPPAEVVFAAGEVIGSSLFVTPGSTGSNAGMVCLDVRTTGAAGQADVTVDLTAVFSTSGTLRFTLGVPKRVLDTRLVSVGGWYGRHGTNQTLDVPVAPAGAVAVTASVTIVNPVFNGHLRAAKCGAPTPPTAAVNSPAGKVTVNSTTVGVDGRQTLCVYASTLTHSIIDVTGWWS